MYDLYTTAKGRTPASRYNLEKRRLDSIYTPTMYSWGFHPSSSAIVDMVDKEDQKKLTLRSADCSTLTVESDF